MNRKLILRIISLLTLNVFLFSSIGCNNPSNPPKGNNDDKGNELEEPVVDLIQKDAKFDPSVVPIDWSQFNTEPLTGELAEGIIYLLNNGNKYIVNDWWNKVWKFNEQDSKEYLTMRSNGEHDIRPLTHMVRTLAASIVLNIYDESITGVPIETAREMAVKLTKSLAKAHYGNTEGGWGNAWQSAYWAADVAHSGWLLWEHFSDKDKEYIQNCTVTEANRFINYNVPYYRDKSGKIVIPGDSKAEENAWNSNILSVACAMMPNHENYNAWMYKNVELMISSFAKPSDVSSSKVVSGFKLSEILNGSNVNEDGTVINHNIVHPDYQATQALNLLNGVFFTFAKAKIPEAILFNGDVIYETFVNLDLKDLNKDMAGQYIYKRNKDGSASHELNYPNGTDWGTDRQICFFLVDVFADILNLDKNCDVKAKDFALARLPIMKAMQDRNDNGQYYTSTDSDRYKSREEWIMWHAIASYLALWADANDLYDIVKGYPFNPAPLTEVNLNLPLTLEKNKSYDTTYSLNKGIVVLPKEVTITFKSSDENIATVSSSGKVSAKKEGKAEISITVTYKDITITDKVEVEVVPKKDPVFNFEDLPLGSVLPSDFVWNNVGTAEIIEEDGNKVLRMESTGYSYIFISDDFDEDFTVTFRLKIEDHKSRGGAHLLFREDSSAFTGRNGYQFCLGDTMNSQYGLELRKRDSTLSDNKFIPGTPDNEWHDFEITMIGDTVTLKMDGEEIMSHELTGFTYGSIALATYLDTVLFDDIEIILI